MNLEHKVLHLLVKADSVDFAERTFEGMAAGIGNVDDGDDLIVPGAFTATLPRISAGKVKVANAHFRGEWIPDTRDLWGKVVSAEEKTAEISGQNISGLWCKYQLCDVQDARDALTKIQDGVLDGLSIGYEATDYEHVDMDGKEVRLLKSIKLFEVSLVVWGMNSNALIDPTSVKAVTDNPEHAPILAGLSLLAAGEVTDPKVATAAIEAMDAASSKLSALMPDADDSEDDSGDDDTDDEEPPEGTLDEETELARELADRQMRDSLLTLTSPGEE